MNNKYRNLLLILAVSLTGTLSAFRHSISVTNSDGSPANGETVTVKVLFLDGKGNSVSPEWESEAILDNNGMAELNIENGYDRKAETADITVVRANGTTINSRMPLIAVPHALGASQAGGLIGYSGDRKFSLCVDDNGNLGVNSSSNELIPIPEGYTKMIFHDEFDQDGMPDPLFWGYEKGYVRGGEMQYYTVERPENAYVKDGLLHIVTLNDNWTDENGETHKVTSASVTTKDKVKFTYGRVDIRAKLPICLGSWPALWMMPNDDVYGYWPNSGEIDIIEHVGFNPYNIYFTAHCAEQNGNDNKYHGSTSLPTCTTEFHVYSLEWMPDRLIWYIDGKKKWTVVKNSTTWRGWPFNQDFYLIMNTAFGGSWGGQKGVDLEALPITFEIDYVRIFQ